jgi:hypothetical protein
MALFSKIGGQCGLGPRKRPCLPLVLTLICLGLSGHSAAVAQDIFSVTREGWITANIADLPLGQALAALSRTVPLEIRGSVAGDERLTLHFSHLTLREALQQMMASYNWVLIRPEAHGKPILVVLGKAARGTAAAPPPTPGLPPSQPTPPPRSATPQPSPSMTPPPPYGPSPPSYETTAPAPSLPATASTSAPVQPPPMPPPPSAGPASESQAATGQGNPPSGSNVEGSAGGPLDPDFVPPFDPGSWGGRGFGRK